ncbi:hypothetical protein C8P64_1794 [Christiangramia gaetbulicola]|uniref:Histidyl-tRNA synthetase n=1 Tax=Christiangramia gaetbulicola TaxID=703340 RepID=A0A2T6AHL1_9FLAO|nr:DUF6495 family protein [Christiangramia gaetbulicola]PTX43267.1 hypothetical protein C8P64_1794 [Christiangramia gaetbulicola]
MKYARLTKEQFEEMHQEFINFLATQSITADEWEQIKKDKPEAAEEELDIFSDLIWEGVLNKVEYLEHFSPNQIFLFHITTATIELIAVKVENEAIDITTREGYQWLQTNLLDDTVTIYTSTRAISDDRNKDIFALIKQGANITQGDLYGYFKNIVEG